MQLRWISSRLILSVCSVSTVTLQLVTCWWQGADGWKLVTLDWPGTSKMTPTMSWEEMYVRWYFILIGYYVLDIFPISSYTLCSWLLSDRCVCRWSGWHLRVPFRGYTPWRVMCGLMASCSGRSSHSVAFTQCFPSVHYQFLLTDWQLCWCLLVSGITPYPGMKVDDKFYAMIERGFKMECPYYANESV